MKNVENSAQNGDWLVLLQRQIASVRYGTVQIVIHDSRVVQMETTERFRVEHPAKHPISREIKAY